MSARDTAAVGDAPPLLEPPKALDKRSLSERTYAILQAEIVSGRMPPGHRIDVDALARTLEVSKTPIKESLQRLALEGLVDIAPRRASFVAASDPRRLIELLQVRRMLEVGACADVVAHSKEQDASSLHGMMAQMQAYARGNGDRSDLLPFLQFDQAFHSRFMAIAGNSELDRIYQHMRVHMQVGRAYYLSPSLDMSQTIEEHAAIMRCIEERDVPRLQGAVSTHIERVQAFIQARINHE